MSLISDPNLLLDTIATQEKLVRFEKFDNDIALELGLFIVDYAKKLGKGPSIAITVNEWQVFKVAMNGIARPDNEGWLRRKHNTVTRFRASSLATATSMKAKGATLAARALDPDDYIFAGGGFPLYVKNAGIIGSICASGLKDFEDHQLVVDACAAWLGLQNVPSVVE